MHLVARDRLEQPRHPLVVVEAEPEELRGLQERRDPDVRLQRPWERAHEVLFRFGHFTVGGAFGRHLRQLVVDRRHRAFHVRRADAGADDQRPGNDVRVECAERIVGHAVLLANRVAEAAAQGILAEDVVHQPVGVVARIGAQNRREPVRHVGLRLVHHRRHVHRAPADRRDRWHVGIRARRCLPRAEDVRAGVDAALRLDVADERQ
jgi:hypothetical protein